MPAYESKSSSSFRTIEALSNELEKLDFLRLADLACIPYIGIALLDDLIDVHAADSSAMSRRLTEANQLDW